MSCGTRAQDVRPGDPDGARLLRSSLGDNYLPNWGLRTALPHMLVMRTAQWPATAPHFGSQPRRPSCVRSGLEPHCRTSRCARPQPTPSPRCCSLTAAAGYCELHLRVLRYCSRRPLITAGHPVRSSVPSPPCNNPGFETPPPHRPAHCNCVTAARQFVSARALLISATRETITTRLTNVYPGQHRFPIARR
jgi:hypothetical protein